MSTRSPSGKRDAGAAYSPGAKDPQLRRDAIWFLVAAVTVVPVAALPWLGLAGGVYLAVTPGALGYGIGVLVASLVIALAVVCGRRSRGRGETGRPGQWNGRIRAARGEAAGRLAIGPSSGDTEDRGGVERCRSAMAESSVTAPGARCPAGHQAAHARAAAGPGAAAAADWHGSMRAWRGGWYWSAPRPGTARRSCWRTGPGAAGTRPRGCRWTRGTTTRPGSGATRWPRWTGRGPGSANGWPRCSGRPRRRRSRGWSRR